MRLVAPRAATCRDILQKTVRSSVTVACALIHQVGSSFLVLKDQTRFDGREALVHQSVLGPRTANLRTDQAIAMDFGIPNCAIRLRTLQPMSASRNSGSPRSAVAAGGRPLAGSGRSLLPGLSNGVGLRAGPIAV